MASVRKLTTPRGASPTGSQAAEDRADEREPTTLEPPTARLRTAIRDRADLLVVVLCGLVALAGLLYSIHLGSALRYPDEREYVAIADNLRSTGVFSLDGHNPTAFRPPAWPILLAGLRLLGLPIEALRVGNLLLFVACLYLVHLILRRTYSPVVGLLGVLLGVVYVLFFYTAGTLYPQMFQSFFLLLALLGLMGPARPNYRRLLVAGAALAMLVLTVPTSILLVPPLVLLAPGTWRDRAVTGVVIGLVLVAIVGAWTVRNYRTFDRLVFVSSNGGVNLLLGNSEHTGPNSGVNVDIEDHVRTASGRSELDQDAYYRDQALDWIRENKHQAAWLFLRKVINHFNFRNELNTGAEASRAKDLVLAVTYGVLLLLAVARLALRRLPLRRIEWSYVILYLLSALVTAIFFTRIRFRVPFDFLLLMLGAPVLAAVLRRSTAASGAVDASSR